MPMSSVAARRNPRVLYVVLAAALFAGTVLAATATIRQAVASPTLLYPDLRTLPPRDLRFATVNVSSDPNVTQTSRVLQFSNTTYNAGDGPLDLRALINTSLNPPSGTAVQRIYDNAGGYIDETVGSIYYHAIHQHYHYEGWGRYELWTKSAWDSYVASGRTTVPNPILGTKTTSCVEDEEFMQNLPGTPYPGPFGGSGCQLDSQNMLHEGLSVGWGDTYDWYRFEQWIDLGSASASLADGSYILRSVADPNNQIYESTNKSDASREGDLSNEATTPFTVSGGQIVDSQAPTGSISLNGVAATTGSPVVAVGVVGRDDVSGVDSFRLSNDGAHWSAPLAYTTSGSVPTSTTWSLVNPAYGGTSVGGPKSVWVQFHDVSGKWGPSTVATISLQVSAYWSAVVADGPAAYWRLGEASGTTAADATGAHPGTYASGVTLGRPSLIPSQTDTALGVGSAGAVSVPDSPTLSPSRLTVEAWFRPDSLPAAGSFASLVTKTESYSLQLNGPRMEFTLVNSSGTRARLQAPSGAIVAGQTYHVVGTWDGTTQRLYLNGSQVAQATPGFQPRTTSYPLRLGSWDGVIEALKGTLDDVAVYPTALTATQVSNHTVVGNTASLSSAAAVRTAATAGGTTYQVSLTTAGDGSGSVSSSDGLLACPSRCTVQYPADTNVSLTAQADPGSVFAGWTGGCGGTSPVCAVKAYAATSATAVFVSRSTLVTVTISTVGGGAVGSQPVSASRCAFTCSVTVTAGTPVTLTALAWPGSAFATWAGACSGTARTCTIVATRDVALSATFRP